MSFAAKERRGRKKSLRLVDVKRKLRRGGQVRLNYSVPAISANPTTFVFTNGKTGMVRMLTLSREAAITTALMTLRRYRVGFVLKAEIKFTKAGI